MRNNVGNNLLWAVVGAILGTFVGVPLGPPLQGRWDTYWNERKLQKEGAQVLMEADVNRQELTEAGLENAEKLYKELVEKNPQFQTRAYLGLSRVYADWATVRDLRGISRGDYPDRAHTFAMKAMEAEPKNAVVSVQLAYALESYGPESDRRWAARSKIEELLITAADDPEVKHLAWLVEVGREVGSYLDSLNPRAVSNPRVLVDVGVYYVALADRPLVTEQERLSYATKAEAFCSEMESRVPQNPLAHYCLGYAAFLRGDVRGAREGYNKALQNELSFPHAHNNLGVIYAADKNYEGARRELTAAVYTPGVTMAQKSIWLHNLGEAQLELGDSEQACKWWEQASDLQGKGESFLGSLGLAFCAEARGQKSDARKHFETAVKLGASNGYDLTEVKTFHDWHAGPKQVELALTLIESLNK